MQNCVSFIGKPIDLGTMACWVLVEDMQQIICTYPLENLCIIDNELNADKIVLENFDSTKVGAVVLHECGSEDPKIMQYQIPPDGFIQNGDECCYILCGFCLLDDCCDVPDEEAYCEEKILEHPCDRYARLRCCLDELICGKEVARVDYEDRSVAYTRANIEYLKIEVNKAFIECTNCNPCAQRQPRRFLFQC